MNPHPTMSQPTSFNSDNRANINHGYATRRYCTPDLSIDITVTTAVQQ